MRLRELTIREEPVMSSWIADLTLTDGETGDITMALGNGRRYSVKGAGEQLYRAWIRSASKGQFFHQRIKNQHTVTRLV